VGRKAIARRTKKNTRKPDANLTKKSASAFAWGLSGKDLTFGRGEKEKTSVRSRQRLESIFLQKIIRQRPEKKWTRRERKAMGKVVKLCSKRSKGCPRGLEKQPSPGGAAVLNLRLWRGEEVQGQGGKSRQTFRHHWGEKCGAKNGYRSSCSNKKVSRRPCPMGHHACAKDVN